MTARASTPRTEPKQSTDKNQPSIQPNRLNDFVNRSTEMQLLHEDMARARHALRLEEAQRQQRAYRLAAARRATRRAEQAAMRARRLLALAVVR